jgi:hypothetical protein
MSGMNASRHRVTNWTLELNLVTTDPRQQALTLTDAAGPAPALVETSTTTATLKTA